MQTRRLHQLRGDANKGDRPDAASEEPLWVVDVGAGQLRLAPGSDALKELIAEHALTETARVYVLSAAAKRLGEIAELQAMFEGPPDASPTTSETEPETPRAEPEASPAEPLIALAAAAALENVEAEPSVTAIAAEDADAAPSNHTRDDDFSLLDRPFDDGDYFEKPPRARRVRAAGVAALVFLLGGGGYRLVHSRSVTRSPAPAPTRDSTAAVVAAPAVAEPVVVAPPPVAAPTAAEATQQPGSLGAPSSSYSALVAEGQRQFEAGRSRRAQELFEQALVETHDGTAALIGLAYVHLDRGRLQQATALFQRALDQDRGNPLAMFGLAESHRQEGDRRAALDEFKTFLTLEAEGSDADIARRLIQELANGG